MFLDPDHPFFAKASRRYALVALCLGWSGFELWNGATIWAGIFGALGAYAAWVLILQPRLFGPKRGDD